MQSGGTGEVTIYPNMIQTDAAINPAIPRRASVDDEGKLIGINIDHLVLRQLLRVGSAIPVNYAINFGPADHRRRR